VCVDGSTERAICGRNSPYDPSLGPFNVKLHSGLKSLEKCGEKLMRSGYIALLRLGRIYCLYDRRSSGSKFCRKRVMTLHTEKLNGKFQTTRYIWRLGDCNKSGNFKLLSHEGFTASKKFIEIIHSIYRHMSVTKSG
jgi:hypothetical protein